MLILELDISNSTSEQSSDFMLPEIMAQHMMKAFSFEEFAAELLK